MRIAIDAMGGDLGPSATVDGALVAARHLQVGLLLVGHAAKIAGELSRHPAAGGLEDPTPAPPEQPTQSGAQVGAQPAQPQTQPQQAPTQPVGP